MLGKKVEIGTKITNNGNNITARRITTLKKSGNVFEDEKGRKATKKKSFIRFFILSQQFQGSLFLFYLAIRQQHKG